MLILICTLGGSPRPVISSIRCARADRVVFVCSDGGGGTESSAVQVPEILAQSGLAADRSETLTVPPDDPDQAILSIRNLVSGLRERYRTARMLADYTGGTKSMSAALLHVAVATRIELRFMTGSRESLKQVRDGTERPVTLYMDFAIAERQVGRLIDDWVSFAYEQAAAGFAAIAGDLAEVEQVPQDFRSKIADLYAMSAGFAAWDRFDHTEAIERLAPLEARYPELSPYLATLNRLRNPESGGDPTIILDLWYNAQRAAARGRYDDATARVYRLLEWIAQWLLRRYAGIDTSAVDLSIVPKHLHDLFDANRKRIQVPMDRAWRLVEELLSDRPIARLMASKKIDARHRAAWAGIRNHSILAHGYQPIGKERWSRDILRFGERLVEAFEVDLREAGIFPAMKQLPVRPPRALTT